MDGGKNTVSVLLNRALQNHYQKWPLQKWTNTKRSCILCQAKDLLMLGYREKQIGIVSLTSFGKFWVPQIFRLGKNVFVIK